MPADTSQARAVFISYAREDEHLILPVVHLLRAAGACVFLDQEDVSYGDKWEAVLLGQLSASERVLVFWSANAANSDWVRREYLTAIDLDLRVVPVPLDATPLPKELAVFQALAALVPLVYQVQRRQASRGRGWPQYYWYGTMFGTMLFMTFVMILSKGSLFLWSSPVMAEGPDSRLPVGGSVWLIGAGALIFLLVLLSLRQTIRPTQLETQDIQVAIYNTVFGETGA